MVAGSVLLSIACASVAASPGDSSGTGTEVRYGRDVRQILSDRCFQCHGTDSATREADLRLDRRDSAIGGSPPAIVPGNAEASELWKRVTHEDVHELMPPPAAKKRPLSEGELDLLRRWIDAGAEYEEHWAFVAPERPELPGVRREGWVRGSIDRFVLAGLEAENVAPAPEAGRETLLRRVHLDLTGLAPTPEELRAFLEDDGEGAYERAVDRIFDTEPYRSRLAEHLTSSWMDAARYADTIGIHTDNGRQMWPWRDWVLAAFRDNMPLDRFVTEQLAGDLLPDATLAQRIASGFNRNHVATDEGGAIAEEYLLEYAVDRVNTTSAVFLGLTMGCARCHDHKYDPITQEDFYGMVGFFNSVDEPGLYSQTPDVQRAYEPFLEVPRPDQEQELGRLAALQESLSERMARALPGEEEKLARFLVATRERAGAEWTVPTVVEASSSAEGVSLAVQADASILATGRLPAFEDYVVRLRSEAVGLRAVLLEAFATPNPDPSSSTPDGAGRASHGNAVISSLRLEQRAVGGTVWSEVPLHWAWSDHTQRNDDFEASNVLAGTGQGWAADGNANSGARSLLLLSEEPFGLEGGTELRATLSFRSPYAQHSLGRIRFRVSPLANTTLFPVAFGRWYFAGPFRPNPEGDRAAAYATSYGPEEAQRIDPEAAFGSEGLRWTFDARHPDGEAYASLFDGVGAAYLGRSIWSPDERRLSLELGSDDGFALFLNGERVAAREVDRGVAPAQDRAEILLRPGFNQLTLKIINTGGPSGYAFRALEAETVLAGELPSALLPEDSVPEEQRAHLLEAWRRRFFDDYRALAQELEGAVAAEAEVRASIPRTMVMKELEEPRPSFVLTRGLYDHPDESRPVERRPPSFLSSLPVGAPRNRLGLAQWLTAEDNALFARVLVNRSWQLVFGSGLVRTAEDFGLQGDWPSHPELLDWLAVELRESGWDLHALLRSFVLSSTYRQSSVLRPELLERDPDNRWLARYPRRRLSAEQIRDHALHAAGLLVERLGGPSVKPYQPEGLWQEVAMLASNTRTFERGAGEDLWRRSLYTYWKRAVPPPSLALLDAPTRESCVIRRQATNTPLQALVLWNDEQFVEAARVLAQRTLAEHEADQERAVALFLRCTSRTPEEDEVDALLATLGDLRARFARAPEEAASLLEVGESPPSPGDPAELAAWTLVASAVFNLHETLTQD